MIYTLNTCLIKMFMFALLQSILTFYIIPTFATIKRYLNSWYLSETPVGLLSPSDDHL